MSKAYIFWIFKFLPLIVLAIKQNEIMSESIPDAGRKGGANRVPFYRELMHITDRNHIRFSVKAKHNALLLLSERPANSIDYYTDHEYLEISIGAWSNTKSNIRLGTMQGSDGQVNTTNILNPSTYNYFWVAWNEGIVKLGHEFMIDENVIMTRSYPATIDLKYLAIFNGFGSNGTWELYAGK